MNKKTTGVALSYLLIVIDIVVGILFVPFLLKSLGDAEYGIYKLMLSTASYLSVLDFGLGGTITRYVIKYKTLSAKKEEANFVAMGLLIYGVLAAVVMVIAVGIGCFIPKMYAASIPSNRMFYAQNMFMVLCARMAVSLFNHAYNGLFSAYERFTFIKGSNIIQILLRIVIIVIGIHYFKSAMLVAVVDLGLAIAHLIVNVFYAKFSVKCKVKLHKWDGSVFKEAMIFTTAILIQAIINQFNTNVDSMVLGIYSTTAIIAMYSLVMQIYTMYSSISTAVSSVFLPSISSSVFKGETNNEITEKVIVPSRIQLIILLLVATGFILFGKDFINVWVGEGYDTVYIFTCIIMLASVFDLSQNSITGVLKAKNKLHGRTAILAVSTLVNFIITLILVPRINAMGAVIGTAFSMLFGYGLGLNLYYHFHIKINMITYYKKTYKGILPSAVISLILGIFINRFITSSGWISFILEVLCYTLVYSIMIFVMGLNNGEKEKIKSFFKKIRW